MAHVMQADNKQAVAAAEIETRTARLGILVFRYDRRFTYLRKPASLRRWRKIEQIGISAADRERLVRDRNTLQKMVWRARIVLLVSGGLTAQGGLRRLWTRAC